MKRVYIERDPQKRRALDIIARRHGTTLEKIEIEAIALETWINEQTASKEVTPPPDNLYEK